MATEESLLAAGGKIWEKDGKKRTYLGMGLVNAADLGISFNEKKHKLFFDCNTGKFDGTSETFVRALNS